MTKELTEDELKEVYEWVDEFSLSRIKKRIERDFADGVLIAEILHEYFPETVWIHSYPDFNSSKSKLYNWQFMKKQILKKIGFEIGDQEINDIISSQPLAVESFLLKLKRFLDFSSDEIKRNFLNQKKSRGSLQESIRRRKKGFKVPFNASKEKAALIENLQ